MAIIGPGSLGVRASAVPNKIATWSDGSTAGK